MNKIIVILLVISLMLVGSAMAIECNSNLTAWNATGDCDVTGDVVVGVSSDSVNDNVDAKENFLTKLWSWLEGLFK